MRLSILGGYLGAGKSTWLRHQLHVGLFERSHVIVNEAAEIPIDHLLLGKAGELTVLAGGCCCCTGADAFVKALRDLCNKQSADTTNPLDHILLETSGLADPSAIAALLQSDPVLARRIALAEIRVVVDAVHGASHLMQDSLSLKQIESADELVITKIDLVTNLALSQLVSTLRRINPVALLIATNRGDTVVLDYDSSVEPLRLPEVMANNRPMTAERVDFGRDVSWAELSVWLSALLHVHGEDLVRVKGCIRTPAGRLLIQSVKRHVQSPEILPEEKNDVTNDNVLVFIGRGACAQTLSNSILRLQRES